MLIPGVSYRVNTELTLIQWLASSGLARNKCYEEVFTPTYSSYNVLRCRKAWADGDWIPLELVRLANIAYPSVAVSAYQQLVLQKAKSKVGQSDLELGESIGEYRETIQMLKSPLSGLKKFLLDDRSRNLKLLLALAAGDKRTVNRLLGRTGLASADAMASTWLELRYGLRPLVGLVQDVVERVNAKKKQILDPDKIRGARSRLTFPRNDSRTIKMASRGFAVRAQVKVEDTIQATASIQYRQSAENGFLDSLGLTPRFLPEVMWQLTTLSFVVDWIFTIGPWLATLRINPDVSILGNTVGIRYQRRVTLESIEKSNDGWNNWIPVSSIPSGNSFQTDTYDRITNLSLSYLPHFTWGRTLDLFKAIDSISLIWQLTPLKDMLHTLKRK